MQRACKAPSGRRLAAVEPTARKQQHPVLRPSAARLCSETDLADVITLPGGKEEGERAGRGVRE